MKPNTNEIANLSITSLMSLAQPENLLINDSKLLLHAYDDLIAERYKTDVAYMKMAYEWADRSKAIRKAVGAIVIQNNQIIGDGYNGMPRDLGDICEIEAINPKNGQIELVSNPLVLHAEANCFNKLVASTSGCQHATIYVTLSPCIDCAKKIVGIMNEENLRSIERVVFHEKYRMEELQQVTALFNAVGIEVVHLQHPELDQQQALVDQKRQRILREYFPHLIPSPSESQTTLPQSRKTIKT